MVTRYVHLVEDDPALRALVRRVLGGLPGVEVRDHDRAESALADFEIHRPLLLICDLDLPGMGGVELIARGRQWFEGLPVIVITGLHSQYQVHLEEMGDVEVWDKPFEILTLRDRVNELLQTELAEELHETWTGTMSELALEKNGGAGSSRYVYLVEDDGALGRLVAKVLSGLPRVEVRHHERAESALADFESHLPQVVVADLGLPGMSGVELIARSRQWFARLPVIVTTGLRPQFQAQLVEFPGIEIWEKPFQILALRERVNELLTTEVAQRTKAFVPFGVFDYLQLASLGGQDLVLKLGFGDGKSATMEIVGGEIWDCHLGVLKGREALGEALEREAEEIDFQPLTREPCERRIQGSTSQILLELAVDHDTARAQAGEELVP